MPLHWAAWHSIGGRYLEFMQALIDAGADIHALDGKGRTPMHLGASVCKKAGESGCFWGGGPTSTPPM